MSYADVVLTNHRDFDSAPSEHVVEVLPHLDEGLEIYRYSIEAPLNWQEGLECCRTLADQNPDWYMNVIGAECDLDPEGGTAMVYVYLQMNGLAHGRLCYVFRTV